MYLISGCLLGRNCKYDGGNNNTQWVREFAEKNSYLPVCPETEGGLKSPRPPAEIRGNRVVNAEGMDVTAAFEQGAQIVWERAKAEAERRGEKIEGAILKAKSPSCGKDIIYDGTFSHTTTEGDGYLTRILKKNNVKVITEKDRI